MACMHQCRAGLTQNNRERAKWRPFFPTQQQRRVSAAEQVCQAAVQQAWGIQRRTVLAVVTLIAAPGEFMPPAVQAAEQGIQPSDYTVPALSSSEYAGQIRQLRGKAVDGLAALAASEKFTDLSNSLVLSPVDSIRQSVLYIPSALLKEGKRQEAIASRKAYTDFLRELKRLDELAQRAARFDADSEDVTDSIGRLSQRIDDVLQFVK